MFIVLEGLDGSGSSTHVRLLEEALIAAGKSVIVTKEPTVDTPTGKLIREVLQKKWEASPEGLQLLFTADRAEHLKNNILPALKEGKIVVCDRYLYSTLAYGSMAVDREWLKAINQTFLLPDLTFLLKLDPAICMERIAHRGHGFEFFEQQEKLKLVWQGYEKVAAEYPNIHVIDADRTIEEVAATIWGIARTRLGMV